MENIGSQHKRKIFSVSELTADIKRVLEAQYPMIWISGEISNLRFPSSGHAYFTLKDKKAQIAAVMFKGQLRQLGCALDDGLALVGLGRISVYEPRGTYQIILEYAEPMGVGALQIAFEQLKQKLYDEGLFREDHKKALPFLPQRLGVITSPTGAVIRDILNIAQRRFPNICINVYPVRVQGIEAAGEIAAAIERANRLARDDVLILARGGGSLEDLAAFNSERVARSIHACRLPIVSAVGHETDFTIADFVADLRAPTPSAAAEVVVPVKNELAARCLALQYRNRQAMQRIVQRLRGDLSHCSRMLVHPGKKIQDVRLHTDQLVARLRRGLSALAGKMRSRYENARTGLFSHSPRRHISLHRSRTELCRNKILKQMNILYLRQEQRCKASAAVLKAVDPLAILNRGYSVTRTLPQGNVVMDAGTLASGQLLEIQLAKGHARVVVQEKCHPNHEEESDKWRS